MKGLIIKGIGGFYYVDTESGIIEAKGRGIFKKDGITLAVGDVVDIEIIDEEGKKGVINAIETRRNKFIRPPIVNVDTFIVTFAATRPKPNFVLVDKFLVMAEMNNVDAVICINKCDLADEETLREYEAIYKDIYPVIAVSAVTGQGIEELEKTISGKTVAFAGPSGVGKSTIINAIVPHANMETGAVSEKTNRGKHTTRHVEIFKAIGGGRVYDTPGFTSFEILEAEEDNLELYYPDIEAFKGQCYYDDCRHLKEPDCSVRAAVKAGKIHKLRYESYVANMEEIKSRRKY
ncbi:MAG: ribosome small subunit-dependent GTPase A [Firmicutes bacterium]|nr:ribosome small subunit-dependent GTPase A [Bacillota bacterium]